MADKNMGTQTGSGAGARRRAAPAAKKPNGDGRAHRRSGGLDLRKDLRDFASARPGGWNHEDWLDFLESLKGRGHDIRDHEAIGRALEAERLDMALEKVPGVGPQRRKSLIERFGTLWKLRNADVDEISREGGVPRQLAERIREQLH